MKVLLIFLLISQGVFAEFVDKQTLPEFPGGDLALLKFLHNHLNYQIISKDSIARVIVGFTVSEDGALSNIGIKASTNSIYDKEAIRVVKLIGKFYPACLDGKEIKCNYVLPINFNYQKNRQIIDSMSKSLPYTIVEQMPEYPGGDIALFKFIEEHLHFPDTIISTNTRVIVGFTVNGDGSLSDISVKKSAGPALDAEALRVTRLIPYHFKPGIQNGKFVRVKFVLPFDFEKKK